MRMNFTGDVDGFARITMFEAKFAAMSAAYCVEDITGVRIVRVDEVMYGQEVDQLSEALASLRVIPVGERGERARAAMTALLAWEVAVDYRRRVSAHGRRGDMVRVWLARVEAVAACGRVKALS
jgi:hypothetical protein